MNEYIGLIMNSCSTILIKVTFSLCDYLMYKCYISSSALNYVVNMQNLRAVYLICKNCIIIIDYRI